MNGKRKIKKRNLALHILPLAVISIGSVVAIQGIKKNEHINITKKYIAKVTKSQSLSGIDIETITQMEEPLLSVNYPKTPNETINQELKKFAEVSIKEFLEASKENQEDAEFFMSFETYRLSENIISFKFTQFTNYRMLAHPEETIITKTYDLSSGKLLNIEDIFKNMDALVPISQYIYEKLSQESYFQDNPSEMERLKDGLIPVKEHYQTFVLDNKELTFYFQDYQIGSNANPINHISIPLVELGNLFNDQILVGKLKDEVSHTDSQIDKVKVEEKVQDNQKEIADLKDKKLVALTFDDGPNPATTPALLEILKKENVPATFFVLGNRVEFYPEIVQEAYKNGNQIASHTYNHLNLPTIETSRVKEEIDKTSDIIEQAIGVRPDALRPPYGAASEDVKNLANAVIIEWSVDSLDWKSLNSDAVYTEIINNTEDGSIILMHDIDQSSVDGAAKIIPELKAQGYTFVTVDQLIAARTEFVKGQEYYKVPNAKENN